MAAAHSIQYNAQLSLLIRLISGPLPSTDIPCSPETDFPDSHAQERNKSNYDVLSLYHVLNIHETLCAIHHCLIECFLQPFVRGSVLSTLSVTI